MMNPLMLGADADPLLREPWQILSAQILTLISGIIAIVLVVLNGRKTKGSVAEVNRSITENVGIANGSGPLMDQVTTIHRRVGELSEHVYKLREDIEAVKDGVSESREALESHVLDSALYRDQVRDHLDRLSTKLDDHVDQERESPNEQ